MSFNDQKESHHTGMPMISDPTYGVSDATMTSLADFFARPIKIFSFSWNVGSSVLAYPNPWSLYFINPRVINRITNYRNIRCQMHVKIVLNGNGFHYGRLLASYLPYARIDLISPQGRTVAQDAIAESQRMHLYLDPTHSQGGTMSLPFFYHKNNLDIVNQEWDDMGDLVIRSLQPLKHSNGATDSVTVSMFAWITDVHLSGPTSTDSGALVPQAGAYDEYGSSPVSSVSSTVAAIAGNLKDIPIISPFAMATEMVANAVAGVAKLFGFSRPTNISAIEQYKPMYCGNVCNADAPDTCQRLTMSCKQELTIDPRTVGLPPVDELSISHIAQKESYLTQFSWDITDTAETLLWNCYVTPELYDLYGAGTTEEHHLTAACYATLPFEYWRGSMKFRFMTVASSFQKGRLRIVYDPWLKEGNEYNTNQSAIIDLAKERDFTIEIGWANSRSFLKFQKDFITLPFKTTPITNAKEEYMNGVISVFVLNELTTPNSTVSNDAAVNVIVSASDDIEVAVPETKALRSLTIYEPQSGCYDCQAGADDDITKEQSAPEQSIISDSMAATPLTTDHNIQVFTGDIVASLRTLAKRYCFSLYVPLDTNSTLTSRLYNVRLPDYPVDKGYAPDGLHLASTPVNPTPYTYANMTFVNYILLAFAGVRGSMRWKTMPYTTFKTSMISVINGTHHDTPSNIYYKDAWANAGLTTSESTQCDNFLDAFVDTGMGSAHTPFSANPVLEYEIPYYSNNRFSPVRTYHSNTGSEFNRFHTIRQLVQDDSAASPTGAGGFALYCAAGEDFMPCFYIGPPILYSTPAPVPA